MSTNEKKGFWKSLGQAFVAAPIETRGLGSTGSYGGDSPLPGVQPPAWGSTNAVSIDQALSIAPVYRAVHVITTTISQLPVQAFRGDVEIDISSANSNSWLRQPNPDITRTRFIQKTVFSMATRGYAFWRRYGVEAPGDQVTGLEVLNPALMSIEYDDNGRKTYRYNGYKTEKVFQAYQVSHLKLNESFDSEYGFGPIQACQTELRGMLDLRDYASNIFVNGGFSPGYISIKDQLDADLAAEYQRAYVQMTKGGAPGVFGGDGKFVPSLFDAAQSQFIENQQFAVTTAARMFGVPASKLLAAVEGNSMTYQNMEQVNTEYVQDTLMAYIKPIEDALSELTPRGQSVKLKVDALLRADTAARYEALSNAAWITDNEKRALDNLPPLPGGDVLVKPTPTANPNNNEVQQ